MSVVITPIYAALLTCLFLLLSVRVIAYRRAHRISLGDADNTSLLKRMRAQANCAEYAPLGIVLLLLAELQGAPALALHLLGLSLVAGRVLHAYGFSARPPIMMLRVVGMLLTLTMMAVTAFGLLLHAII